MRSSIAPVNTLKPRVLVYDLASNFAGLEPSIYRAFIDYGRIDCPSAGAPCLITRITRGCWRLPDSGSRVT